MGIKSNPNQTQPNFRGKTEIKKSIIKLAPVINVQSFFFLFKLNLNKRYRIFIIL